MNYAPTDAVTNLVGEPKRHCTCCPDGYPDCILVSGSKKAAQIAFQSRNDAPATAYINGSEGNAHGREQHMDSDDTFLQSIQGVPMTRQFHGGLEWPGKLQRVSGPWILMTATGSSIEFSLRIRWLRRFFGPWRVERSAVREVYVNRPNALAPWTRVRILAQENMPWCFLTQRPYEILDYLERLGYPVSSPSKH